MIIKTSCDFLSISQFDLLLSQQYELTHLIIIVNEHNFYKIVWLFREKKYMVDTKQNRCRPRIMMLLTCFALKIGSVSIVTITGENGSQLSSIQEMTNASCSLMHDLFSDYAKI